MPYDWNKSNEYYLHNSNQYSNHNGPKVSVILALCDDSLAYKYMKYADVDLHLFLSHFLSNLTREKRLLFELILVMVQDKKKMVNYILIM